MLQRIGRASACVAVVVMVAVAAFTSGQMVRPESGEKQSRRIGGGVLFEFDRAVLAALGWEVLIRGDGDSEEAGHRLSSAIQSTSTLSVESVSGIFSDISSATIETHGAVLLTDGERRVVLGNLTIAKSADGLWTVREGLNEDPAGRIVAVVDAFKGVAGAVPLYAADLYGCIPNQIVDAIDIVSDVDAFKGFPYPQPACPGPCW